MVQVMPVQSVEYNACNRSNSEGVELGGAGNRDSRLRKSEKWGSYTLVCWNIGIQKIVGRTCDWSLCSDILWYIPYPRLAGFQIFTRTFTEPFYE